MLKKLVKYGNSNALVLDRSILALLNIDEGSVVKLRIEGNTLIIKAEETVKPTDSMILDVENIHNRIQFPYSSIKNPIADMVEANLRKDCKDIEKDPSAMESLEEWLPGTKNAKKLQNAYSKIMKKYANEIKLLGSEEFKKELAMLNKKYQDPSSKDLIKEFLALRLKHAPRLAKMDEEMKEVNISLGVPSNQKLK